MAENARPGQPAVRWCGALGLGAVAVLGAWASLFLLRPGEFFAVILIGSVLGGILTLMSRAAPAGQQEPPPASLSELLDNALLCAGVALSLALLSAAWGYAGWLLLGALLAGGAAIWGWSRYHLHPSRTEPTADDLGGWTTAELVAAWTEGLAMITASSTPEQRARLAVLRGAYLDELERRDRPGVQRWLSFEPEPGSDPRPFLSRD